MSYRHRMQLKLERSQRHNKEEREDRIAYAEPHLRDYEDAYLQANGETVQIEYKAGWCVFTTHGRTEKYRLQALISMTAVLQARVHEAVITNKGDA